MREQKRRNWAVWPVVMLVMVVGGLLVSAGGTNASGARSLRVDGPGGAGTPTATGTPGCTPVWVEKAPLPRGAMGLSLAVSGGYLYAFGGRDFTYNNLASTSRYDPASDSWTALADMPAPRNWAAAAAVGGYVYVVNGSQGAGPLNTVFRYEIASNSWMVLPPMLGATYGHALVALNGDIYRIGGLDPAGVYTSSVEILGQGFVASMPEGRSWASAVTLGGYIYVAGGSGKLGESTKTFRYDPSTDTWSDGAIADLPEPKAFSAAGALDGRFVVAGGGTGSSYSSVWAWDPQSDAWESLQDLLYPRFNMPGAVVGDVMHVVGGINDGVPTDTHQAYEVGGCATATAIPTASASATATPTLCVVQFTDVPQGHTFYEYIRCLACQGIVSGYDDGTFRPENGVTRGQLSKIVANAAGFVEPVGGQQFEDVPVGSTFFDFVWRLADRGMISGYQCGGPGEPCVAPGNLPYFRPGSSITRGQIAKIVANAAGFVEPVGAQQFEDVPVGSTFFEFVWRLADRGIMSGYPCGGAVEPCIAPGNRPYFRPGANATRGQASKIVANAFYPDCSGWSW